MYPRLRKKCPEIDTRHASQIPNKPNAAPAPPSQSLAADAVQAATIAPIGPAIRPTMAKGTMRKSNRNPSMSSPDMFISSAAVPPKNSPLTIKRQTLCLPRTLSRTKEQNVSAKLITPIWARNVIIRLLASMDT